ncbi:PKD domain-containing protein [Flavihumibacter petaseus]|uniref:PKD domain-containing protein n=1 Tax=Flavihumibacter petaseus TaxID=549295 RepID=UPI0014706D96|nr:PKD domain-containing protein [Flavihumibacter petaseus]
MRTKHIILLLLLAVTSWVKLLAQAPVPKFTADVTQGCSPLVVRFTDQSTGAGPLSYQWDLGNGVLTTSKNPVTTYVYDPAGNNTFTVKLNVRNQYGVRRTEGKITVYPSANVVFRASNNIACAPIEIQYTDLSTVPSGSITGWLWDFGDGTTSTLKNPKKLYTNVGYYNVTLTVTTSNGCTVTNARPRFMRIIGGITPNFEFSRSTACTIPVDVTFNNQTTGPGILSHKWVLGNGLTSNDKNPTTVYDEPGTFNVKLVTTSNYGCKDSLEKPITFSTDNTSFIAPDSVCPDNPVQFTNQGSSTPTSATWDFGDGTTSLEINPVKAYTVPGIYTVKLINAYAECTGTFSRTIKVTTPPDLGFLVTNSKGCQAPHTVKFQDTTANSSNWLWDFGDGTTSTEKNPEHIYTTEGQFSVTLTVTNALGCPSTVTKTDIIEIRPPVDLRIIPVANGGCVPFDYKPSFVFNSLDTVVSYQWDFGDGSTATGPFPVHTYTNYGRYEVKVTVTTSAGCSITYVSPDSVRVGTPPTIDFTVSKNAFCAGEAVDFTSLATPADQWIWLFGDEGKSSEESPSYMYQDTGRMDVTLIAFNNGCPDTLVKEGFLTTYAPVAKFVANVDCSNPRRVSFENLSIEDATHGTTTYFWDFGNGTTSTLKDPPPIIYSSFGSYTVSLTAKDDQCQYRKQVQVNLYRLNPEIETNKPQYCPNDQVRLTVPAAFTENITEYLWSIEGVPTSITDDTATLRIPVKGNYDVSLSVKDKNNCWVTVTKTDLIKIVGAENDFSVANNGGCVNAQIGITDLSTPPNSIKSWRFTFGDGTDTTFTALPITHSYTNAGTYSIRLITVDNFGCKDTTTKTAVAIITKPQVNFMAEDTIYCPDVAVSFFDMTKGNGLSYQWDFGDNGKSTAKDPVHTYTGKDTSYTVRLIVTDENGCIDSLIRTSYIRIAAPTASFELYDSSSICPPLETKFVSTSTNVESLLWDFGDGNLSNLPSTSNFYNTYGKYTATLTVTGYHGCKRTASAEVNVYNPNTQTVFTYNPLENCNTLTANFTIVPPPNTAYSISFGDGTFDSSQATNLTHTYLRPGIYSPRLTLYDSLDCQVNVGGSSRITVNGILPDFDLSSKAFCDTGTVAFQDYSLDGADSIVSWNWTMGDGGVMTGEHFSYHFANPGTYLVTENMTTAKGCVNSRTDTVRVYRTPLAVINGPDEVCVGNVVEFRATTVVPDSLTIWKWTYNGSQNSAEPVIRNNYSSPGTQQLALVASNLLGCSSDTTKEVMVWPNPVITNQPEVSMPVGGSVTLPVSYSSNVMTWTWTPANNLSCTNCGTPTANPQFTTNYNIAVVDSNGCRATSNIVVTVLCVGDNYFIPNTFSPNNDGQNDVFYPRGKGLNRIQSMRIFNRWGEIVFEKKNFPANDRSQGWDGMVRGMKAQSDAYVYIIEVICDNGQIVPLKGNVTLIR